MHQKLILCRCICKLSCYISVVLLSNSISTSPVKAQSIERLKVNHTSNSFAQAVPLPAPQDVIPQPQQPLPPSSPSPRPETLPPPEELLEPDLEAPPSPPPSPSPPIPGEVPETITIKRFNIVGNTAISDEELNKLIAPLLNRPVSLAEILQAPKAITRLYLKKGYITSGAVIPPQTEQDGVVTIQVIEGSLEAINIEGTRRLDPEYIRDRLPEGKPLNESRLLEALQLLQLNPLIRNISAEIKEGSRPARSRLTVRVTEAETFSSQILLDNERSPSVGSFKRGVQFTEANLLGIGDGLSVGYNNTDGSNGVNASYTLPVNPRNGTIGFYFGTTSSSVIEDEFEFLDIDGNSNYYELIYRQPLIRTPTREFAVGLIAARRESNISSSFFEEQELPLSFLSPGADAEGRTRVSALSFFQEWTNQNSRQVFAVRSSFNLGIGAFNATVNDNAPDSRFFSWRGQAQLIRLLAPETLLLLRTDIQLSPDPLVPIEQFGLGGINSVRGYRQDALLADNGVFASAEVRIPIYRSPLRQTVLQLTPFVDIGTTWENGGRSRQELNTDESNVLASFGLGLRLQLGNSLTARIDWGIPLTDVADNDGTLQEDGIYFSIVTSPF